jgi:hypothetical protein
LHGVSSPQSAAHISARGITISLRDVSTRFCFAIQKHRDYYRVNRKGVSPDDRYGFDTEISVYPLLFPLNNMKYR